LINTSHPLFFIKDEDRLEGKIKRVRGKTEKLNNNKSTRMRRDKLRRSRWE
jgi:uncharacterized protein YdcH (DUF465 family)